MAEYGFGSVKNVVVVAGADATTELVAAQTGVIFRVISVCLTIGAVGTASFRSGTGAGTDISGTWEMASDSSIVLPPYERGWFETVAGERLALTMAGVGANGAGLVKYVEVG